MSEDLVLVENLAKFRKAVRDLDKGLSTELTKGLKAVADLLVPEAQAQARSVGLNATGKLIGGIKGKARTKDVILEDRVKSKSSGFSYPALYEYGGAELRGTHGNYAAIRNRSEQGARLKNFGTSLAPGLGPRAFLAPAIVKSEIKIIDKINDVLNDTARRAGWH